MMQFIPLKRDDYGVVTLTEREVEVLYLADYLGMNQETISKRMNISQASVSRTLKNARFKLAKALFELHSIVFFHKKEVEHMKVAFATQTGGVEDVILPMFARAPTFTIVQDDNVSVIENTAATVQQGAGIAAVQLLINNGVEAVVAGSFGPRAAQALQQAGIRTYVISGKRVKEVWEDIKNGVITPNTLPIRGGFGRGMGRGMGKRAGWGQGR